MTAVADGVLLLPVALPEDTFMSETSAYLVHDDEGGVHLIDTGWTDPLSMASLEAAFAEAGVTLDRLRTVVATHLHADHLGLAAELRERTGARVALSAADTAAMTAPAPDVAALAAGWGAPADAVPGLQAGADRRLTRPNIPIDLELADGDVLPIPGRAIRVVATPGHTSGSVCLDDAADGVLFTGDTVLPGLHPGLGLGADAADPISGYLAALARLAADFDDRLVLPGHGAPFRGLADRIAAHVAHLRRRTDEVAAEMRDDPGASLWQIAARVRWTAGWENLGRMRYSALRQTAMHAEHVRSLA